MCSTNAVWVISPSLLHCTLVGLLKTLSVSDSTIHHWSLTDWWVAYQERGIIDSDCIWQYCYSCSAILWSELGRPHTSLDRNTNLLIHHHDYTLPYHSPTRHRRPIILGHGRGEALLPLSAIFAHAQMVKFLWHLCWASCCQPSANCAWAILLIDGLGY